MTGNNDMYKQVGVGPSSIGVNIYINPEYANTHLGIDIFRVYLVLIQ